MQKKIQKDGKWKCGKCNKWKTSDNFYKDSRTWNHLRSSCKSCISKSNRKYMYQYNLKKYGLNHVEYKRLFDKQNGVCAICNEKQVATNKNGRLCIDHDHETGQVRGLLCNNCNTALGLFKDDIKNLLEAIEYINKSKN